MAITENESWRLMSIDLGKAIAYLYRVEDALGETRGTIMSSTDVRTKVDLLLSSNALSNSRTIDVITSDLQPATNELFRYIEKRNKFSDLTAYFKTLDEFLAEQEFKLSTIVTLLTDPAKSVSAENSLDTGHWEFEFDILDEAKKFVFYHFELQLATDALFSNIIFTIDSSNDVANWFFERDVDEFKPLLSEGVGSNFATRRMRYVSKESQFLTRTQKYYLRSRQKDNEGIVYDYRMFSEDIIFT